MAIGSTSSTVLWTVQLLDASHLCYWSSIKGYNTLYHRHDKAGADALPDNEKLVDGAEVPNPAIGDGATALVEAEEVGAGNVRDEPVPIVVEEAPVAAAVVEMLAVVVTVENKGDEAIENPVLAGFDTRALEEAAEAVTELPVPFATENDRAVEAEKGDGDEEAVAGMEKENAGAGAAELGVDKENAGLDAAELEVEKENAGGDVAELVDTVVSENPGAEDTEVVVEALNNETAGAEEVELADEAPRKENADVEDKELAAAELANENAGEEEAELEADWNEGEAADDEKPNEGVVEDDPKGEEEEDPNIDEGNGVALALVAAVPVEAAVDDENGEEPNKPKPELEPEAELDKNKPDAGVPDDPKSEEPPRGDELAAALAEFAPNNGELLEDVVDPKRFVVIPEPEDDPNMFEVVPEPDEDPKRTGVGPEPEAALDENPNDGVEALVEEPKPAKETEEAEEAEEVEVPKPKEGAEEAGLGLGFEKAKENGEEPEADDVVAAAKEGVLEEDGFEEKEKGAEEEENEKPVDIVTGATAATASARVYNFFLVQNSQPE
ncbi:hypothetical protein HAX54_050582 [Datura stramonium]|uniref:Uncharacterized protein n=1 Tax=Datura stramonium TaxID=4076 RepID=A0ABS8SYM7_DATST|nr:hypothetical protein [Datura stramonium]